MFESNCQSRAANRGWHFLYQDVVSVGVKAVSRMLLQGTFVFGALQSLLCDFDNDIDLHCRSGFYRVNICKDSTRTMNGAPCTVDCVIWMPVFVGAEDVTPVFSQIKTRDAK